MAKGLESTLVFDDREFHDGVREIGEAWLRGTRRGLVLRGAFLLFCFSNFDTQY